MNPEPNSPPAALPGDPSSATDHVEPAAAAVAAAAPRSGASGVLLLLVGLLAVLALASSGLLWQRLLLLQEQQASRSEDAGARAIEARALAQQAQTQVREATIRLGVLEARLSEVALESGQIEELRQSLSRSRDETLVVDLESLIHLAIQQAELTGSLQPLLSALLTAEQRVQRSAQPRLAPLHHALVRDLARIKAMAVADTSALLVKLDELSRMLDELPLVNAAASEPAPAAPTPRPDGDVTALWLHSLQVMGDKLKGLVRVSRIENPEAALLSPEQSFFLRENLKLKLLNTRLELLTRQEAAVRADLASVAVLLNKYFDPVSERTQAAKALLQQLRTQTKSLAMPQLNDTLTALSAAAAGR